MRGWLGIAVGLLCIFIFAVMQVICMGLETTPEIEAAIDPFWFRVLSGMILFGGGAIFGIVGVTWGEETE